MRNNMNQFNKIITIVKETLNLSANPRIIIDLPPNHWSYLDWDKDSKLWIVYIPINYRDSDVFHEIGHIYLFEKTKYRYFAKPEVSSNFPQDLKYVINRLLDLFVDHNVLKTIDYYNQFIKDYDLEVKRYSQRSLGCECGDYIYYYYCCLEFLFTKKAKNKRIKEVNKVIKKIQDGVIKSTNLTYEDFRLINKELGKFRQIKKTNRSDEIVDFITEIIHRLPFQDLDITTLIKIVFP